MQYVWWDYFLEFFCKEFHLDQQKDAKLISIIREALVDNVNEEQADEEAKVSMKKLGILCELYQLLPR
jgi:hypothetical protein